ncbi:class I SAM-dependent methyltransferase [Kitasatospora sp. NPDC087315]|uniref:class I SAM-dependent methyltransferase n=1 Tax=Kitasatospora sp. NPDC087315 TaxID=3364069 RepID=UPI00382A3B4E
MAGHQVVGSDLSPVAAARAAVEAAARGGRPPAAAADMRRLPFGDKVFDVLLCSDNSLPHLLSGQDLRAALLGMRRVLRDDGLLMITIRAYDEARQTKPTATPPREALAAAAIGRLPLIEARMLAWLACQAAAAQQATVRQLAGLPGPTGRPIGVKETVQITCDLMDTGLVVVPGLTGARLDQPLPVFTAGYRRPETKVVEKRVEIVSTRHGTLRIVGTIGLLRIPAELPDDLRGRLLALGAEFRRIVTTGPGDLPEVIERHQRKADALREWERHPLGNERVRTEADRAQCAADAARQQYANQQAKQRTKKARTG